MIDAYQTIIISFLMLSVSVLNEIYDQYSFLVICATRIPADTNRILAKNRVTTPDSGGGRKLIAPIITANIRISNDVLFKLNQRLLKYSFILFLLLN
jgi:hypothetical protein